MGCHLVRCDERRRGVRAVHGATAAAVPAGGLDHAALYAIEVTIRGHSPEACLAARHACSAPLCALCC